LSWHRIDPRTGALVLAIHAQPNAKRTEVVGLHGDALKIRLAAPALDGRANDCLVGFIAERLGVKRSQVNVVQGESSRNKVVSVAAPASIENLFCG
jgi:uncharacterized protein (TIGR00251 family)